MVNDQLEFPELKFHYFRQNGDLNLLCIKWFLGKKNEQGSLIVFHYLLNTQNPLMKINVMLHSIFAYSHRM